MTETDLSLGKKEFIDWGIIQGFQNAFPTLKSVVLKARNPINPAQANKVSAVWGGNRLSEICMSKTRHFGYLFIVAYLRHDL